MIAAVAAAIANRVEGPRLPSPPLSRTTVITIDRVLPEREDVRFRPNTNRILPIALTPLAWSGARKIEPDDLCYGRAMRKLVVQQWVTVDNFAAEEDGGLGFVSGEPFDDDIANDPFRDTMMAFIDSVDTMILGGNTYNMAKAYWPYAEEQGEYGRKLNGLTKFVASSRLDDAPWGDFPAATVTRDPAATIRALKEEGGKDIWLWGSLSLMNHLMDAGVVDELRMLVCPATRGRGARLFQDEQDLELLEAAGFDSGVVLLRYAIKN